MLVVVKVRKEKLGLLEILVPRDKKERLELQVQLDLEDLLEELVQLVAKGRKVRKELLVIPDQLVQQVMMDLMVLKDKREKLE